MRRSAASRPGMPVAVAPHVLARTTGALYAAGGLATLLAALADPASSAALFAVAATALATGGVVLRWGSRIPHGAFHVLVAAGSTLIATAVSTAPSSLTAVVLASVYTFVAIDVFYYFRGGAALAQLALLLALAAWSSLERGVAPLVVTALEVVVLAVAFVIGDLAARASFARRDHLTGLLNRRSFEEAVDEAVADAERTGSPVVLALLDVDHFKGVNDSRGHAVGDELLRHLASHLVEHLPGEARVARLGGDEFAVLLVRTPEEKALEVLERARTAAGHPLSLGAAGRLPQEPTSELARRADAALYRAKQLGRDRSELADAASGHLARDLAAALADPAGGGLHVVLQPVVAVASGEALGVEALLRWDHPARGAVPPAEFVHVAERAGLVRSLGAFARRSAFREVALLRTHRPDLVLTVNASGHELVDDGYAAALLAELSAAGLPPESLVVEVTESVVEGSSAAALTTLEGLRTRGVRVAVDDFGAGYSTFSRLTEVPADYLKLDGALLAAASTSERHRRLFEAALGVGAALGMDVVAEGVETPEHARLLAQLGCRYAQGYHYGRPERAGQLLARWSAAGSTAEAGPASALDAVTA
ncbi:bifunctional diguanylate cyclase/phosphodiesterase [Streptomyces sp. NP160]|uniref:putative bifunctional diguanylate cyclase/phosphodiesterase n=1 Tax=Streptomyces sp. NP160 TaxID=2586637 RepID=UPI0011182418|nr:bifunctional diguanylate cyclase/phosphodiesterase [Streptomyces sp. NP160]TNM62414.1 bifunctional diguanylate cyclase/phosphodiesterase [Streptomyces sp. NP160]